MRQMVCFWVAFFLLLTSNVNYANEALVHRKEAKVFVEKMARQYHFDRKQLNAFLREAVYQPKIIESMQRPFEKKTWDIYKDLFLQPERIQAGLAFWQANQKALSRAEKEFGVPPSMIVAIIGVETLYGKHQGNYRVLDALTTLAFYYPKRSGFFTNELGEYLLLCREKRVPVTHYLGSYAGAIGKPQFMPSSYRFYAVDYTGNGKRDLVNNDADSIGSVANYFHRHGWRRDEGVIEPVNVQGPHYKKLTMNTRSAGYEYKQLLKAGIKPFSSPMKPPVKAGLIELTNNKGQEYWLAYPNFYVITHYNTSPQYALVVYLLSQQLFNQWALNHQTGARPHV